MSRPRAEILAIVQIASMMIIGCARTDVRKQTIGKVSQSAKKPAWLEHVNAVPVTELRVDGRAECTSGGIFTRLIKRGDGRRRASLQDAVVLYSQVYDTSGRVVARGQDLIGDPANDLNRAGREALTMMVEHEVRRVWFPDAKSPTGVQVTDYEIIWLSPDH